MIYQWYLYHCRAGHFHFLSEPEVPSWPFWSLWAGNLMLDLISQDQDVWSDEDWTLWQREIARMREELTKLTSRRRRNNLGQFVKGRGENRFMLPKKQSRWDQGDMAKDWQDFFAGKLSNVFLYDDLFCQPIPVTCDFIHRRGEKAQERRKKAWLLKDMINAPTKPIKVSDRGIIPRVLTV